MQGTVIRTVLDFQGCGKNLITSMQGDSDTTCRISIDRWFSEWTCFLWHETCIEVNHVSCSLQVLCCPPFESYPESLTRTRKHEGSKGGSHCSPFFFGPISCFWRDRPSTYDRCKWRYGHPINGRKQLSFTGVHTVDGSQIPNNHLGCSPNLVNNGRSTANLNWWMLDFWTIIRSPL